MSKFEPDARRTHATSAATRMSTAVVMTFPRYRGEDDEDQPVVVTAVAAWPAL